MTFAALLVTQKREKKKLFYVSSRANDVRPYHTISKSPQQPKQKIYAYPLFLLHMQAQKKKLSKRKRRNKISRSAEHDHRCRWTPPPFEKGGRKLYREQTKILLQKKKRAQKSDGCPPLFIIPFFRPFSLSAVLPFHRKQTVYFRPMQLPLRLFSAGLSSAFPRRGACRF